ncbi:MAG: DUF2924 domain-containing protein [Bradyrhizobiaceae bacterium]|nr:DUF2924 domain-containing protein [Bradyrhizobiaceae bacterium]
MAGLVDPCILEDEIARLRDLELSELRRRWEKHYRTPAPKTFRREFLIRAVAYQMQVEVYGGLKPATRRRLRQIAEALREGREEAISTAPRIKPGTALVRSWRNETHTVMVLEEGFAWKGKRYRSLSQVARAITGTQWNGLVFFGIKPRPGGNKNAQKRRDSHA